LNLKYGEPLSDFAINVNCRPYNAAMAAAILRGAVEAAAATGVSPAAAWRNEARRCRLTALNFNV